MNRAHPPAEVELRARHKQQAAERAVEFVASGMIVGLGTGSTAIVATRRIARLLHEGQPNDVFGCATSSIAKANCGDRTGAPDPLQVHRFKPFLPL
jgi:ribose 5-phosphate isomerase